MSVVHLDGLVFTGIRLQCMGSSEGFFSELLFFHYFEDLHLCSDLFIFFNSPSVTTAKLLETSLWLGVLCKDWLLVTWWAPSACLEEHRAHRGCIATKGCEVLEVRLGTFVWKPNQDGKCLFLASQLPSLPSRDPTGVLCRVLNTQVPPGHGEHPDHEPGRQYFLFLTLLTPLVSLQGSGIVKPIASYHLGSFSPVIYRPVTRRPFSNKGFFQMNFHQFHRSHSSLQLFCLPFAMAVKQL